MSDTKRTARRRRLTRDHIAGTAAALFERHGYSAVTMEQIAAGADVARGTLYNHFPIKEAVLAHWMHSQLASDLEPLLQEVLVRTSFVSRLAALLEASAQWWETHRQYAAPYIGYRFQGVRDEAGGGTSSDLIAVYIPLILHAQENNELRKDASPERLAQYLHFLYLSAIMTWLGREDVSLADEFAEVLDFFLQGAAVTTRRMASR